MTAKVKSSFLGTQLLMKSRLGTPDKRDMLLEDVTSSNL